MAESISHYTIIRKLGAGGMGEVYLAEDTKLRRRVALKTLLPGLAKDEHRAHRFLQEAHAASVLSHPNIAVIYEIGEADDGTPFIAMEYIEGTTLDARLTGETPALSEFLEIAIETADALDEAHSKGVMHRDIKPSNLMLTPRGHVKVLDFGLAKLLTDDATSNADDTATRLKTDPGLILGTVSYMSPEQAIGRPVDHRSDLFSLGVVLYEMTTGRLPFSGKTTTETIEQIRHAQPEAIARYNYTVPAELERIIRKLLEKDPANRFQSARDLVVDLKNLRRDSSSGERVLAVAAPPRKSRVLPMAIAAAVLVLAAIGWFVIARREPPPPPKAPIELQQVTFEPGLENEPSLSRDGKFLAYTTDEGGNLDVRVLPTSGGQAIRISDSDADDGQPAWSPDGSKLAFVSARDHQGRLSVPLGIGQLQNYVYGRGGDIFITSALGGTAVKLVSDGYYPAWSPDGKQIAYQGGGKNRDLWIVGADGGESRRLTNDAEFDYHPAWSPDGKWIVYGASGIVSGLPTPGFMIRVVPTAGGPSRNVNLNQSVVLRPMWSADGLNILFSSSSGGRINVWKVPFDPKGSKHEPERITSGEGNDVYLSGPDTAGRLAYTTLKNLSDIYELTVASGTLRQVTSETVAEDFASLSSDGKTLLLTSLRDGALSVWTANLQGKLLSRIGVGTLPRWAPDGQQFAYLTNTREGIVVRRLGDLASKSMTSDGIFAEWAPDGTHLLYERPISGGRAIFAKNLESGAERQISGPIGSAALTIGVSPNGKRIAYQAEDGKGVRQIWIMPLEGGSAVQMTSGEDENSHPRFSPTAPDRIIYLENHKNIILKSLGSGVTKRLTDFRESNLIIDYPSWSPDGTKIYFTRARNVGDIFLLKNY